MRDVLELLTRKAHELKAERIPVECQYHPWVWLNRRGLSPFEPHLEHSVPDAPEWALWAREAWLAARQVPAWWLDHRLVPTGEFGGLVGDDSDMYQNYVDFAFLESDGLATRLMEVGDAANCRSEYSK